MSILQLNALGIGWKWYNKNSYWMCDWVGLQDKIENKDFLRQNNNFKILN